jgi:hypothetical protein
LNLYSTESTDWFNSLPSIILAKTDGTNLLINSDDNYFNILDSNNIDEDEESYYDYEEHDHGDEVLKEIKSVYKVKKVYSSEFEDYFLSDFGLSLLSDTDSEGCSRFHELKNMDKNTSYLILKKTKSIVEISEEMNTRLKNANDFIITIANLGRRFFSENSDNRSKVLPENPFISDLQIDKYGDIWFKDYYTKKLINTTDDGSRWRGFTSGGTLQGVIEQLTDHILNDSLFRKGYFETNALSPNHCWGYGEDLLVVKNKGIELGIISAT